MLNLSFPRKVRKTGELRVIFVTFVTASGISEPVFDVSGCSVRKVRSAVKISRKRYSAVMESFSKKIVLK